MSGTKEGSVLAVKTMIHKWGKNENGKSIVHVEAGRKGGLARVPKGFSVSKYKYKADDPRHPISAGKKGGKAERKTK